MRSPLYKPTDPERSALLDRAKRLQRPGRVLELLRTALPTGRAPAVVTKIALQSSHPDRFVLRVQARTAAGTERVYAVKAYCDDLAERVWSFTQAIASQSESGEQGVGGGDGRCLPIGFARREGALVFPWIDGVLLSNMKDERTAALLHRAAELTADLHRLPLAPEPPTTVEMLMAETRARCDRMRSRWPAALECVEPVKAQLEELAPSLDPAQPAPVHGDLGSAQFVWTGDDLILFDWDRFAYTDPAYDVGHFLGQLDRVAIVEPAVRPSMPGWTGTFLDTYAGLAPRVSLRNVAFYRAMILTWKVHTMCRLQPVDWPLLAPQFALAARTALQSVPAASTTVQPAAYSKRTA